jgi:CelD/BcsL family acetyltransferase involved in cellulose biosynthesis
VFYGFGTDYKQEYKEHSPGVLMLYYLWQHMIEQGSPTFDFCGGDYHYKKQYTDVTQHHSTFQLFHSGMKSRLIYWAKTVLLPFYRKMLRKPPPGDFIMCRNENN